MSMLFKRIKDWATAITAFRTGDVISVDGPSGTAKMSIPSDSSDAKSYILRAGQIKAIDDVGALDDTARQYKMIAGDASENHPSGTVDAQRIVRDGIDYRVEECAVFNGTTTNKGNLYCVRCVPTIQVKKGDVVFVSTSRTLSDGDSYSFGFFELDAMYQRVTVDGHTIQRNIGDVKNYDGNDCYVVQADLTVYVGISLGEFSPSGAVVAIRQTDFDDDFVIRYYGQDSLVFLTDFIEEQSKKIDSTNAKVSSNLSKIEAINEAELLASGKEYELTGATSSRTVSVNLAKGSKIRLDVPEYTKTGSGTAQFFVRSQQGFLGTMTGVGTRIITLTQDTTFLTFGYAISGEVTSVSVKYALNFDVANNDTTDYIDLCAGTKFSLNGGEYKTFACRFPKGSYKFSVSNSVTSGAVAFYVRNPSFTYSAQLTDDGSKTFTLSDAVDFLTISSAGNVTSFDFTLEKVDDVVEVQKIVISPDGEYATLRAGFAAITSADAEVYVEAGEYDIIAEFGDSYFENFDDAVSNRHGIFVGDTGTVKVYFSTKAKVTCNYEGNNPLVFKNFSPFLILGPHVEIYGLWLRSKNVRYAIHDDANESTSMFRLYENCDIEHTITEDNTNANYHCCIGGGLHNDTNVVVRNCVFALGDLYTSPDAVSYHNGYASGAKSQVSIVNNYFKGVSTFRASWYGSSIEKTQVLVTGNSFGSAPLFFAEKPDQFDVHNMDWLEWNNIVRS